MGPTTRMSRAKIGSNAVTPPSSTTNKSSVITPRSRRSVRMNSKPASTEAEGRRLAGRRGPPTTMKLTKVIAVLKKIMQMTPTATGLSA